jgi:Uma2 family endonuclease
MRLHRQHIERRMGSMRSFPTSLRHVRPVQPLAFPASDPEWHMPESKRHRILCVQLLQLFTRLVAPDNAVGSDQFVYFDAANPKRCLAPDAFIKLGVRDSNFDSWKTWEHGAPELCVEVLARDTSEYLSMREKRARYRALGVRELVVFNFSAPKGKRLQVYDRVRGDLVERVVVRERTPCVSLSELLGVRYGWRVAPSDELDVALRLDSTDGVIPTLAEELHLAGQRRRQLELEKARLERALAKSKKR